jgi:site-specific DNA recombinase
MNKAVAYIRVSLEEQVDGHSLDNQLDKIAAYCKLYDLELVDVLRDEGISGRKTANRPGFNMLMDMVKNKRINHVIALSFTRFARNTMDTLSSIDMMIKHDVAFHSITEKITTDGAIGKFLITLFAGLSQFESDTIGDRTRSVKRFCKENGRTYTQPVFGFDNKFEITENGDKVNGKLVPNEAELTAVRQIFEMKNNKATFGDIALALNSDGFTTKKKKQWTRCAVMRIVKNDIYKIMKVA